MNLPSSTASSATSMAFSTCSSTDSRMASTTFVSSSTTGETSTGVSSLTGSAAGVGAGEVNEETASHTAPIGKAESVKTRGLASTDGARGLTYGALNYGNKLENIFSSNNDSSGTSKLTIKLEF